MKQAVLFLVSGGLAAAVNVGARLLYSMALPLPAAVVLAYITGMVVAFLLNRWFVFDNARDQIGQRAGRFVVVNLLAVLQTLVVTLAGTWLLLRLAVPAATAATAAHIAGVIVPVFSSYLMHKRWTFSAPAAKLAATGRQDG